MVVEFKDNNCFSGVKDIFIRDGKKLLKIFYGANGDLYFDIFGSCNKNENGLRTAIFSIKQHDEVYQYFEQLVNCIIGWFFSKLVETVWKMRYNHIKIRSDTK